MKELLCDAGCPCGKGVLGLSLGVLASYVQSCVEGKGSLENN